MAERGAEEAHSRKFRALIAVHRPRYRARIERAMAVFDWEVRSLLNKEDPVGLINRKPPHIFFVSDDFGRQKDLGILRAVQKYRGSGMRIVGVFDDADSAERAGALTDSALVPPWKTADAAAIAAEIHRRIRGETPRGAAQAEREDGEIA